MRGLSFALMAAVGGCAPTLVPETQFESESYLLKHRMYTFAVYNDEGRLISDPLFDLMEELSPSESQPVTDVYVIAHGWNYTLQESMANFHGYMEMVDQLAKSDREFRPFVVFVSWPSVTRPLGDIGKAVLPFELDRGLAPLTSTIDGSVFFLPSAWKQTLNALTVAIGKNPPNEYFLDNRLQSGEAMSACEPVEGGETAYGIHKSELQGRDCPVSAWLFTLMKWKESQPHHKDLRIHVIGHSYGAKLATLASIEALRRWERDSSPFNHDPPPASSADHDAVCAVMPLESLVLFNPAFNPREITYLTGGDLTEEVQPVPYLQCIPRKAIVYSRRDHATGGIFNLSQMLMDNRSNTFFHQYANWGTYRGGQFEAVKAVKSGMSRSEPTNDVWSLIGEVPGAISGAVALAGSVALGPMTWAANTVVQLPQDFAHHVSTSNCMIQAEPADGLFTRAARGVLNSLEFFVPLCHVLPIGHPFPDDADQMGLFRSTMPALGNTGLDKLVAGRGGLFEDEWGKMVDARDHATNQSRDQFCALASQLDLQRSIVGTHAVQREYVYSFDGSAVLNTLGGFAGAHGDLREKEESVDCGVPAQQKRQLVFTFAVNFTKGKIAP